MASVEPFQYPHGPKEAAPDLGRARTYAEGKALASKYKWVADEDPAAIAQELTARRQADADLSEGLAQLLEVPADYLPGFPGGTRQQLEQYLYAAIGNGGGYSDEISAGARGLRFEGVSTAANAAYNSDLLDDLLAESLETRKTLVFPANRLRIPIKRPVGINPQAPARGQSRFTTTLLAMASMDYMMGYDGTQLYEPSGLLIKDLGFDGGQYSVDCGVEMDASAFGGASDLYIKGITGHAVRVRGSLITGIHNLMVELSELGLQCVPKAGVNTLYETNVNMPTNSMHLTGYTNFINVNRLPIDFTSASSLQIERLGIELCGRNEYRDLPLIRATSLAPYYPEMGVNIQYGHCERCQASALLELNNTTGNASSSIRMFAMYGGSAGLSSLVTINQDNNGQQRLTLDQVTGTEISVNKYTTGSAVIANGLGVTVLVRDNCVLPQGFTKLNGATIINETTAPVYTSLQLSNGSNFTPNAPTAGDVNDTSDTFDFTVNPDLPTLSEYEYTTNAGSTYAAVTVKPIVVGNVNKAAGQIGVRVKAASGRNPSSTLYNTTGFTATGGGGSGAETITAFDDAAVHYSSGNYNDGVQWTRENNAAYPGGSGSYSAISGTQWVEKTMNAGTTAVRYESVAAQAGGFYSVYLNGVLVPGTRECYSASYAPRTLFDSATEGVAITAGDVVRIYKSGNSALFAGRWVEIS